MELSEGLSSDDGPLTMPMRSFIRGALAPMIKAAIQRALNAWAINHAFISFTDVSALCDQEAARGGGSLAAMGLPAWDNAAAPPLRTSCSHAEL